MSWLAEILDLRKGFIIWVAYKGRGVERHSLYCTKCCTICWSILKSLFSEPLELFVLQLNLMYHVWPWAPTFYSCLMYSQRNYYWCPQIQNIFWYLYQNAQFFSFLLPIKLSHFHLSDSKICRSLNRFISFFVLVL